MKGTTTRAWGCGRGSRLAAWALVIAALGAAACGRKAHGGADAGQDDGAAASADGVNAKDVARFADEASIEHEAAKLTQLATVRLTPPRGEPVVNLEAGTEVVKLASHESSLLVSFTNPKSGERTMGWIPASATSAATGGSGGGGGGGPHAFGLAHDAGGFAAHHDGGALASADAGKAEHKTCAAGKGLAKLPDGEECLLKCKTQADCPNNTFCTAGVLADTGHTARLCFKVSN